MGMPNEQEDTRLSTILGYISTVDKKQVASVKISFEPVMAHNAMNSPLILPLMEVVFKASKE